MTIRFERTYDLALVKSIVTHPALYEFLSDDFFSPAEDFRPNDAPQIVRLLAYEGDELLGLFSASPINAILWQVDHALLPSSWGRRAREAAKAFFAWLWENTPAVKAVGFTPGANALALRFARSLGMRECGRLARCYQKHFQLQDLVIFEKDRPSWQRH